MASILRTGKFLRYFAGLTRNVVVNSVRDTESSSLLQNTPCMCTQFQNGFAIDAAAAPKTDLSLDKQIKRLDNDVRRTGRISRRDIEDVLEEIRVHRSATSTQSLLVIRCCGNLVPEEMPEVRTVLVQKIWKTFNALNVPMDISHYNALLRVYLENEHTFSPTDFLAEIESKSIEPNRVTYQRLIAYYCQQGDIDGATRILEHMREKKLPVNEAVFNSLILGHSQANDMESAKGIFGVMKQAGLEPTADTYSILLCCYGKHGDIDSINATFAECEKNDILLLDKDILDIIYSLTVNGHGDKIDMLLKKFHLSMGFNQDCVNTILRLTNKGCEDVCMKLLRIMPRGARSDGQPADVGHFFIRQLVKANRPLDKILSICKTLQDEGLNSKPLLVATEAGLHAGLVNITLPLLTEMKNSGLPIRQHYFWPLICSADPNQIFDIVRKMQDEFNLTPTGETLRDYVIPNLKEKNFDNIITLLREAGVSIGSASAAACYAAISSNRMNEAARIMETYRSYYNHNVFRQPLIQSFNTVPNYDALVRCIRQMYDGVQKREASVSGINETNTEQQAEEPETNETEELASQINKSTVDVVGDVLLDIASYFRSQRVEILETLLPKLVAEGFTISSRRAEILSDKLGSEMTPNISENLGKLSSGELELNPLSITVRKRGLDEMTVDELERFIANVEAKGENSNNIKRSLVSACFRSKNLEKTLQVLERLEKENFAVGSGINAQLIDMYVQNQRIAEALTTYEKAKSKDDEFYLDNLKAIGIVEALLSEERLEDALKFLAANKKPESELEAEPNYTFPSKAWRVLNALAESGDAEKLQKIFDAFVQGNYFVPNNVLLGPLIKVHLVNDNVTKAIEVFERICEEYKTTPWKNELARRLIEAEDAVNLQKITDLSTNIHGEINSLYDLVFSFVECGRIRQARKILETPGLRTRPQRIDTACERYKKEGMVEPLEGLVEATRDLNHIDRNSIYYSLLLSYSTSKDAEKALGLWTKMQDECITPSEDFLIKLAELLKSQNMAVPFAVPEVEKQTVRKTKSEQTVRKTKPEPADENVMESIKKTATTNTTSNIAIGTFRKALGNNELDSAIKLKEQLGTSEQPSVWDVSRLIEQLVKADRLNEATKYVNELLAAKLYPTPKVFKYYLNRIANTGDTEAMKALGNQLNDELKRVVSFDNRYCHANIVAGKVEQYFKILSEEIAAAKNPEEVKKLAEKFPRGGALGILEKHPELEEQFEKLAEDYAKHNQLGPINVLWIHHISRGNEAASKVIWNKHLSNAPRLMFQRVLQTAREQNDDKLAETVISQLRGSKISEGAIGNAYSCLIDIQTGKGNTDKALETLKTALKDVCLEQINRTALQRIKTMAEAQNKEFPYMIPAKKTGGKAISSSSSSSSSDDDVTPKRPETIPTKPSQKVA